MWNDLTKEQRNERTRKRLRVKVDESNYFYYPETVQTESFQIDKHQRAAVYARVSTFASGQASSFELQQTYYKEFIQKHEQWELVKIYADEGISGTSLKHRDAFNEMMADAKAGKIDLMPRTHASVKCAEVRLFIRFADCFRTGEKKRKTISAPLPNPEEVNRCFLQTDSRWMISGG